MIEWPAAALTLLGAYLISEKRRAGFLALLVGSVLWTVQGFMTGAFGLAALNVVFLTVHTRGWFTWGGYERLARRTGEKVEDVLQILRDRAGT